MITISQTAKNKICEMMSKVDKKSILLYVKGGGCNGFSYNFKILDSDVNPNKLATTASEIEEVKVYELVARSIIDSIITDGFYNQKIIYQT